MESKIRELCKSINGTELCPLHLERCLAILNKNEICSAELFDNEKNLKDFVYKVNLKESLNLANLMINLKLNIPQKIYASFLTFLYGCSSSCLNLVNFDKYLNEFPDKNFRAKFESLSTNPAFDLNHLLLPFSYKDNESDNFIVRSSLILYYNEHIILKDLLNILNNMDGKYIGIERILWNIKFKPSSLQILPQLHPAMPEQIKKICETGRLYQKIQEFVTENATPVKGKILQTLASCIKDELIFYIKFLANIEDLVALDENKFNSLMRENSFKINNQDVDQGTRSQEPINLYISDPAITIQKLYVLIYTEPQFRLQSLFAAITNCKDKRGTEILNVLYQLCFRANHLGVVDTTKAFLRDCYKPLGDFLMGWLTRGQCVDYYREFLIEDTMDIGEVDVWTQKFSLNQKMIPIFFSENQIYKILLAGKSLYFLREVCKHKNYTDFHHLDIYKINEHTKSPPNTHGEIIKEDSINTKSESTIQPTPLKPFYFNSNLSNVLNNGGMENLGLDDKLRGISLPLANIIDTCYHIHSQRLTNHLLKNLKLIDHFRAIRDHVMLGRGDFSSQLISALETFDQQPCNNGTSQGGGLIRRHSGALGIKFFGHKMLEILEEAIRNSNSKYISPHLLNRLSVTFSAPKPDCPIWEMFCLKYNVDGPLSVILTNSVLHNYKALFLIIWRTKWLCHMLLRCWASQKNYPNLLFRKLSSHKSYFDHDDPHLECIQKSYLKNIGSLIHSCHIMVTTMLHFLHQIQYYFNFEIMECSWDHFMQNLEKNAHDLDKIIASHDSYLKQLIYGFLLAPNFKMIYTHLLSLYDLVFQFLNQNATIYKSVCRPLIKSGDVMQCVSSMIEHDLNVLRDTATTKNYRSNSNPPQSGNMDDVDFLLNNTSAPYESLNDNKILSHTGTAFTNNEEIIGDIKKLPPQNTSTPFCTIPNSVHDVNFKVKFKTAFFPSSDKFGNTTDLNEDTLHNDNNNQTNKAIDLKNENFNKMPTRSQGDAFTAFRDPKSLSPASAPNESYESYQASSLGITDINDRTVKGNYEHTSGNQGLFSSIDNIDDKNNGYEICSNVNNEKLIPNVQKTSQRTGFKPIYSCSNSTFSEIISQSEAQNESYRDSKNITHFSNVQRYTDKLALLKISFQDLMKDFLYMLIDTPPPTHLVNTSKITSNRGSSIKPPNTPLSTGYIFNTNTSSIDKNILNANFNNNNNFMQLFYLNFRLDFNDFYKNMDIRLRSSLTFFNTLSNAARNGPSTDKSSLGIVLNDD